MEMSKEYIAVNDLTSVDLEVYLMNHKAISFYKKHGFIEVGKDDMRLKMRWLTE